MDDYAGTDTHDLIKACIRRDAAAWSVFTKRYSGTIMTAARNRLRRYSLDGAREDVEDIAQGVLKSIWQSGKLEQVKDRSDISHWLAVVSANAAVTFARRKRLQDGHDAVSMYDIDDGVMIGENVPAPTAESDGGTAGRDISEAINRVIEALPRKERMAVKLNIVYGKKYREVAEIMRLPSGTVSSYIKRAKERLRKALNDLK